MSLGVVLLAAGGAAELDHSPSNHRPLFTTHMPPTLTPRTIMQHLMTRNIAINAKVTSARLALIPTRLRSPLRALSPRPRFPVLPSVSPIILRRHRRKRRQTAKTLRAPLLPRARPGYFDPIAEREEVVVRPRQMRGENEREIASRTRGGEIANFGFAATAQVPAPCEIPMAGAECGFLFHDPRGETHHEQRGLVLFLRFGIRGAEDRRGGDGHELLPVVYFIHSDAVVALVATVGFAADLRANVHTGRETDDAHADTVADTDFDRVVNVARVGGEEGAENDDDFAGAVGGRVVEGCAGHVQGVLERGVAFGFCGAEEFEGGDVVVGVAGHVAYADGEAFAHAEDA